MRLIFSYVAQDQLAYLVSSKLTHQLVVLQNIALKDTHNYFKL